MKLDMTTVKSVAVGGGQVAKSRVGATLAFGIAGLASKGAQDRTEMAIHLTSGEAAFFIVEGESPFEVRAKILPLLREANVPFENEIDALSGAPDAALDSSLTYKRGGEKLPEAGRDGTGFPRPGVAGSIPAGGTRNACSRGMSYCAGRAQNSRIGKIADILSTRPTEPVMTGEHGTVRRQLRHPVARSARGTETPLRMSQRSHTV